MSRLLSRLDLRALVVATVTLACGLALFEWGSGHLRGFGGDVLIVVLLVSLAAGLGLGTGRQRLAGVGLFAVGTELFQGLGLVGPDSHWLLHLTVGSTFDLLDLLAYAAGLGVAVLLEGSWAGPELGPSSQTSPS